MIEHFFQCPYCWQNISMLLEPSVNQCYIEDCEVCCQPIRLKVEFDKGQLVNFSSDSIEQ